MGNAAVELGKKPKGTPKPKKQENPFLVLEVRRGRKNLRFFLPPSRYKIRNYKNYKTHKTYKNMPSSSENMGNAAVELGKKPKGSPKPKKQENPFFVLEAWGGKEF
jgi:uncharacterized protein YeaC (DUF1315 family)